MRILATSALFLGVIASLPAFGQPVEAVLRLNERASLEQLAKSVTDPASPRYRQFYTPEEIRDLVAPTQADYDALLQKLATANVEVVAESKSHMILTVKGEPEAIASIQQNKEALSAVAQVATHDDSRHMHPMLRFQKPDSDSGAALVAGVALAKIRQLYGFNPLYTQGLSGAGQHIAIATYDAFYIDDVRQYYVRQHLSPAPVVDQVLFNGTPTYSDQLSDAETGLDAQFSGALAPQAQIHVFASAHNDDPGELQMFTAILDDNRSRVVNYSWGGCEGDVTPAHQAEMTAVFNRAVAQGVNILAASGDSGAYCPPDSHTIMPDWPAAHPAIVAIGGTKLNVSSTTLSEVAWSFVDGRGGSGGGISTIWALPDYQSGLHAPFVKRSYPDVSFNADPASGQAAYVRVTPFGTHAQTPSDFVLGGTSIAAPQWAGFLALVEEARARAGKTPLGFLNPIVYAMGSTDQASALHPILSGQNGPYQAGPGWNAVCGWGSLHADMMLNYLTNH